ncbi:MAG: EamA family transporter [Candidatus Binatia bacterium]
MTFHVRRQSHADGAPGRAARCQAHAQAYAAWIAVCFFWGTTYVAIRVAVESYPPFFMAGIRFVLAGSALFTFLALRGYALPGKRQLVDAAVVGVALLTVANGLVAWSEQWVPSGLAALVVATLPFWMIGIEAALPRGEKITARQVLGVLVGFAGLLILFSPDLHRAIDRNYLKGIFGLLLAPASWAAGSIYAKYRAAKTDPLMAASLQMIVGGVVLLLMAMALRENRNLAFDPRGLFAVVYLIIFGSIVGYVCFIYILDKLPSSTVSLYAYINPVIAVILGKVILNERMDLSVIAGTGIILFGVLLVQTSRRS